MISYGGKHWKQSWTFKSISFDSCRIQKSVHSYKLPFPIGDMKAMSASLTVSAQLSPGFALDWGLRWEDSDILHRLPTLSRALTRPGPANTLTTLHITIMITAVQWTRKMDPPIVTFRFSSFFWHCKYLQLRADLPLTFHDIGMACLPLSPKSSVCVFV